MPRIFYIMRIFTKYFSLWVDIRFVIRENIGFAGSVKGGVPERSKGSDCKSDGYAFEGSNPSPTTMICGTGLLRYRKALRERYAGMVQW